MKRWFTPVALVFMMCAITGKAQHAFMEQRLLEHLAAKSDQTQVPIILLLEDAVDPAELSNELKERGTPNYERPKLIMRALKEKAESTQADVLNFIEESGLAFSNLRTYWIANMISLEASEELVAALAEMEAIERIDLHKAEYGLMAPEKGNGSKAKSLNGSEPGLTVIGAPEMWALGYTGQGRVGMTFDTGVWPDHPALSERFLPNLMPLQSTWFGYDSQLPTDKSSSHGTHVSGIMLGLDPANADTIGVAPRAYFIATDPIVSNIAFVKPLGDLMLGYEWAMNPDGDEETVNDIPDVINNSWGRPNDIEDQDWGACSEFVIPVMDAVLAAGIANVTSAGNDGPNGSTIGIPANINTGLVNTFAVGAVNGIGAGPWIITNFSSIGPSVCGGEGSLLIKPEVSAPGLNVRSSVGSDEYDLFSGTSMAAPHVSGAVLLLKEAFPYLTGEDLLLALYNTAMDQGPTGEDNTFGMGVINVKHAFDYLSETYDPIPPASANIDVAITAISSPTGIFGCGVGNSLQVNPVVSVRNNGIAPVTELNFAYNINGEGDGQYIWTGQLEAGGETEINLNPISFSGDGLKELHVKIAELENEYDVLNNNRVKRWTQLPESAGSFAIETFDQGINPDLWTVLNPDGVITWDTLTVIQSDGTEGLAAWMNHPDYNLIASQEDYLVSPVFASATGDDLTLSFDYFYRKRGNSSFQQDTLVLTAFIQCNGESEEVELWRAGGPELWTNPEADSDALPETADDWVEMNFSIPEEWQPVYFSFVSLNRRGNNLLIDNINFGSTLSTSNYQDLSFSLFPNPGNGIFTIEMPSKYDVSALTVFDASGRKVAGRTISASSTNIDLSALSQGLYFVEIRLVDGNRGVEKLIIR